MMFFTSHPDLSQKQSEDGAMVFPPFFFFKKEEKIKLIINNESLDDNSLFFTKFICDAHNIYCYKNIGRIRILPKPPLICPMKKNFYER